METEVEQTTQETEELESVSEETESVSEEKPEGEVITFKTQAELDEHISGRVTSESNRIANQSTVYSQIITSLSTPLHSIPFNLRSLSPLPDQLIVSPPPQPPQRIPQQTYCRAFPPSIYEHAATLPP